MEWGFFTPLHIISLLMTVGFGIGLYFLLRGRSVKVQTWVMFPMSFLGIISMIFNIFYWPNPLENLPLHLCAFNAIVLPIAVMTKNKVLCNLLLVWCLGALAALILNNEMSVHPFFSWPIFFYYWPHVIEFCVPILLFALGLVKKDPKCIFTTVGITLGIYTLVHFANLAINSYAAANGIVATQGKEYVANYMYSLASNNPLVDLFIAVIPGGYWHMYLAIPIVVVYLLIVYAPELIRKFKKKKTAV